MTRPDLLHPPEVQRVADPQPLRVAPSPPQPDPSGEPVQPAARRPRRREGVPPVVASDALDDPPQGLARGVDQHLPPVGVEAAARPARIGGQGIAGRAGKRGGGPAGRHSGLADTPQSEPHRLVERDGMPGRGGHVPLDAVLVADDLVPQGLGERTGDGRRHGRHQTDPEAGQAGREDRHGDDQPGRKARHLRVPQHHVPVGQHIGPADVEGTAHVVGHARAAHEDAQHVPHRDGLDPGVHPAGGDHGGQAFGEIAQHLEGGRARADDDGGPQHGGGDTRAQQDAPDLGTRPQMRGQAPLGHALGGEAAQVDDAPHARSPGPCPEVPRGLTLRLLEVAARTEGVHQVVRDADAAHGARDGTGVGDVRGHDLDIARPWMVAQPARRADQAAHPVARGEQLRYQPAADVPRRTGHQAQRSRPGLFAVHRSRSFASSASSASSSVSVSPTDHFHAEGRCGCTWLYLDASGTARSDIAVNPFAQVRHVRVCTGQADSYGSGRPGDQPSSDDGGVFRHGCESAGTVSRGSPARVVAG